MISGGILLWHGTIASIPSGFVLCDGNNSTPDLRDKFIVGAKEDDVGVAKSNLEGSLKQTGGSLGHLHAAELDGACNLDSGTSVGAGTDFDSTGPADASGDTDTTNAVPPYYALAYIMKT